MSAPPTRAGDRDLGSSARRGVVLLVGRQVAVQGTTVAATIVLARLLEPSAFGAYGVITAVLVSVTAFGDLGLGASLLQRGRAPDQRDVDRCFTLTALVAAGLVGAFCAAVLVVRAVAPSMFGQVSAGMLCAAAASVLWWAFRAPAAVQYEVALDYRRMAVVELVEAVLFQAVAVVGALLGLGVWSFVLALNARTLVGSLWLWSRAPLRPGPTRDLRGARHDVRFGARYQLGWLAQSAASVALPAAVAPTAGTTGLGLFLNASSNANRLNPVADILTRVGLPAFARARLDAGRRHPPETAVLRVVLFVLVGWATVVATQAELLTVTLFGPRWAPAAPLLVALAPGAVAAAVTLVCGTSLASAGRPGAQGLLLSLRLVLMFPAFLLAGHLVGLLGVAWASTGVELVAATAGLAAAGAVVARSVAADLLRLAPAVSLAVLAEAVLPDAPSGLLDLLARAGAVGACYGGVALALHRPLRREVVRLRAAVAG